jgi:hypothetical protein
MCHFQVIFDTNISPDSTSIDVRGAMTPPPNTMEYVITDEVLNYINVILKVTY